MVLLGVLALFVGGSAAVLVRAHQQNTNPLNAAVSYFVPAPEALFHKNRIHVLVLGIDYNYDLKGQEFSNHARSDTIMSAALDFPSKTANVLSVPRDMDVVLPTGHEAKINEAYADGGITMARDTIGNFLGMPKAVNGHPYDRFVVLRVNATKELIDAIGGIDVPVKTKMDYDDNWGHLHIHFKPGVQHMNGDQAVSYSRFRHDALGDIARIERQQEVVRIMVAKLKNDKFNDLVHINDLIGVLKRNVHTNLSDDEIRSLAVAFSGTDLKSIKMAQVPYTGDVIVDGGDNLVPDNAAKAKLVAKLMLGPMGPQPTAAPIDLAAIKPSTVRIEVRNGSGVSGLGAKMAEALRAKGFVVDSVGNASTFGYETTEIHTHSHQFGVGEKVQSTLGAVGTEITPDPASSTPPLTDVTVIVGKDFATRVTPSREASAVK